MRLIAFAAAAAAAASLSFANAAQLVNVTGEAWDGTSTLNNVGDALALIGSRASDAQWDVTTIDYANGDAINSVSTNGNTLDSFIGVDAPTRTGSNLPNLQNTAFRFTGMIQIDADDTNWSVGSDDGFRLSINESLIGQFTGTRGFNTSSGALGLSAGLYTFELIFFERTGQTGVEFMVDGSLVDNAAVPIPGAALLMGGALFAGAARKRAARKA
ncbi:MAG: hypothetical protein HRU11_02735 [Parvularculaceae bacterium]|nr:hypothetical protein [Parvularculaceae bacterium]